MPVRLLDLLNVASLEEAAALWPSQITYVSGFPILGETPNAIPLISYLNSAIAFRNVSPGADGATVGLIAEAVIVNGANSDPVVPIVFSRMDQVEFHLLNTGSGTPTRVFATQSDLGTQIIIEALPVEIRLPKGLILPLPPMRTTLNPQDQPVESDDENDDPELPPLPEPTSSFITDVVYGGQFVPGQIDSLQIIVRDIERSSIFVHLRVRITELFEIIIESAVPISIGPCSFMGMACRGLHDVGLVPCPTLSGGYSSRDQALEWARHPLDRKLLSSGQRSQGVFTVRTIDLDDTYKPLADLIEAMNADKSQVNAVEFVVEDTAWLLSLLRPLPTHGRFGIRRRAENNLARDQVYSFSSAPLSFKICFARFMIERFLIQTPTSLEPLSQFIFLELNVQFRELLETTLGSDLSASELATLKLNTNLAGLKEDSIIVVEPNTENEEVIKISYSSADTAKIVKRGTEQEKLKGTFAKSHTAGSLVQQRGNQWTFALAEDWTVQMGYERTGGHWLPKIVLEASIQRLTSPAYNLLDSIGGYLEIHLPASDTTNEVLPNWLKWVQKNFEIRSVQDEPAATVITVGWRNGLLFDISSSHSAGLQIIFRKVARIILREVAWVSEQNGGEYFSISGGLEFGSGLAETLGYAGSPSSLPASSPASAPTSPPQNDTDDNGKLVGLHVRRLRFLVAGDKNAELPPFLFDGISLFIPLGEKGHLNGSFSFSEFERDQHAYREMGGAVDAKIAWGKTDVNLGIMLFTGKVSGPSFNYRYLLLGIRLPVFVFQTRDVLMLFANNMAPNLPATNGGAQEMRLLDWYNAHINSALTLPDNRDMASGGWIARDNARSFGLGCSFNLGQCSIRCVAFLFNHDGQRSFLGIATVYYQASAVAKIVIEYDSTTDSFSGFATINLSLTELLKLGEDVENLNVFLKGSIYFSHRKGSFHTLAIGQINDPSTWMRTGLVFDTPMLKYKAEFGFCMHRVNEPSGPRANGLYVSFNAFLLKVWGKLAIQASFRTQQGLWDSASNLEARLTLLQIGGSILFFYSFPFAISFVAEWDRLGPRRSPVFRRITGEFRIETPAWLPDLVLRYDDIEGSRDPSSAAVFSAPLGLANAVTPVSRAQTTLYVSPLKNNATANDVYSIEELRNAIDAAVDFNALSSEVLVPVGLDSILALEFNPPMDDRTSIGQITPPGASIQESGDLKITNELIEIGIRRRPRFQANASWVELLSAGETASTQPDGTLSQNAIYDSPISVQWDQDRLCGDQLDPRCLLINANTPYLHLSSNPEADESHARSDGRWPCCSPPDSKEERWYSIDYSKENVGERVQAVQRFTNSESTLHWSVQRRPVASPGLAVPNGVVAARLKTNGLPNGLIATIVLEKPAKIFDLVLYWTSAAPMTTLKLKAWKGLSVIAERNVVLTVNSGGTQRLQSEGGFTSVTLSVEPEGSLETAVMRPILPRPRVPASKTTLEFVEFRYRTVSDITEFEVRKKKCAAQEQRAHDGYPLLTWLPNHDYEITLATRATLNDVRAGLQSATARQRVAFRTKGIPGLNAVENTGDELERYISAVYPRPGQLLYRNEPVAIAFDERLNALLAVNRTPDPTLPDELNQIVECQLAVTNLGMEHAERVTQVAQDWIVEHRTTQSTAPADAPPQNKRKPSILNDVTAPQIVRSFESRDDFQKRLENMKHRPGGCRPGEKSPSESLVLMHNPVDPALYNSNSPQSWAGSTFYKAWVQRKNAPFVARSSFVAEDLGAFVFSQETGLDVPWGAPNGFIAPSTMISSNRHYAVFGDANWDHIKIQIQTTPGTGSSGIACGVSLNANNALKSAIIVSLDTSTLTIGIFNNNSYSPITEIAIEPMQNSRLLEVCVYDDLIRAQVGTARLETSRTVIRSGKLALVATPGAAIESLTVEPLPMYCLPFTTSRYRDFNEHIDSAQEIPESLSLSITPAVLASLYSAANADHAFVPTRDVEQTNYHFERWLSGMACPLMEAVNELKFTLFRDASGIVRAVLLQSPEPLAIGKDVTLKLSRRSDDVSSNSLKNLEIGNGRFLGILDQIPVETPVLGTKLWAIHCRVENGITILDTYTAQQSQHGSGLHLNGRIVHSGPRESHPALRQLDTQVVNRWNSLLNILAPGQIVLATNAGDSVAPPVVYQSGTFTSREIRTLNQADHCNVLLVPINSDGSAPLPLKSGIYKLEFMLNRIRYNSVIANADSMYHSQAQLLMHF